MTAMPAPSESGARVVRRAACLVVWWTGSGPRVANYATAATVDADPVALAVLDCASEWMVVDELVQKLSAWDSSRTHAAVADLLECGMLQALDRSAPPQERAFAAWRGWNPAAAFFHRATRMNDWDPVGPGSGPPLIHLQDAPGIGRHRPGIRQQLPPFERHGSFADVVLARRTWRRFGAECVALRDLSMLLGLTFGIQHWIDLDGERVALRTSPSGGARHSIEAYVIALNVADLPAAVYHYCPDTHALLTVADGITQPDVGRLFPDGSGFDRAGAIVFATSLFGRVQQKYDFARAYRVVLLEAGHFCQTFCLLATSLGLAPFCTAAFVDDAVDQLLDIDGVSEAAIYAMGVGTRPAGADWAPWPFDAPVPGPEPPGYLVGLANRGRAD